MERPKTIPRKEYYRDMPNDFILRRRQSIYNFESPNLTLLWYWLRVHYQLILPISYSRFQLKNILEENAENPEKSKLIIKPNHYAKQKLF